VLAAITAIDITVKNDFVFHDRQVVFDNDTHYRVARDVFVGRDAHHAFDSSSASEVSIDTIFAGCDIRVAAHAVQHAGQLDIVTKNGRASHLGSAIHPRNPVAEYGEVRLDFSGSCGPEPGSMRSHGVHAFVPVVAADCTRVSKLIQ
jgi:hypothetical protein